MMDTSSVTPGQTLKFTSAELARITGQTAGRAPKGHIRYRATPRHRLGRCPQNINLKPWLKSDGTKHRPTHPVMLHAITPEKLQAFVVTPQRDLDSNLPKRNREQSSHLRMDSQTLSRSFKIAADG
jgi:hypothetical protein